MKRKLVFLIILVQTFFILSTCKKDEPTDYCYGCNFFKNFIYKSKMDYSKYVAIRMSSDHKVIKAFPSDKDAGGNTFCHITSLTDNYYLSNGCIFGINTGFLNITREDFQKKYWELEADDYIDYILEADPFLEYYEELPCDSCLNDTASINKAIRNNELEKYYKRLK